jgi:hypothetical protein
MSTNRLTGRSDPNAQRLMAALAPTASATPAPTATPAPRTSPYGLNYDPNYLPSTGTQNFSYTDAMNQGYSPAMSEAAARGQGIPQYTAAPSPTIEDPANLARREQQGNGMGLFAGGVAGMMGAAGLINALGGGAGAASAAGGSSAGTAGTGAAAGTGATAGTAAGTAGTAAGTAGAVGRSSGHRRRHGARLEWCRCGRWGSSRRRRSRWRGFHVGCRQPGRVRHVRDQREQRAGPAEHAGAHDGARLGLDPQPLSACGWLAQLVGARRRRWRRLVGPVRPRHSPQHAEPGSRSRRTASNRRTTAHQPGHGLERADLRRRRWRGLPADRSTEPATDRIATVCSPRQCTGRDRWLLRLIFPRRFSIRHCRRITRLR